MHSSPVPSARSGISASYLEHVLTFRTLTAAAALTLAGVSGPALVAAPAHAFDGAARAAKHTCTHTSSGSCIRGGQFCPKAKKGHFGYSASGKKYKCRGGAHPHWRNV